ncbi:MAG: thiamine pyrophosphate-dependent dehydrogenase E1 component subunit alpha [bacterium]|nr:thiamine pyrophosphate-dependent dehydrogenase E1 component subunit alpha [bacterium]
MPNKAKTELTSKKKTESSITSDFVLKVGDGALLYVAGGGAKPASELVLPAKFRLTDDEKIDLLYLMKKTRGTENKIIKLYRQGKIVGGVYTGAGQEATSVGTAYALEKGDYLVPMHRDMGSHIAHGQDLRKIFSQYLGRVTAPTRGKEGNMHMGDFEKNITCMISHLGSNMPVAVGIAYSYILRNEKHTVLTYIGDGGASIGDFHEALNFASVVKAPLVLCIENNQFAYSTPTRQQYNCTQLADRALAYGIPGYVVDGNDVEAVYSVTKALIERAREGEGPALFESISMRMHGHSAHDDAFYVPKSMFEEWARKDPILRYQKKLMEEDILSEEELAKLDQRVETEIEEAAEWALQQPEPPAYEAALGVYADEMPQLWAGYRPNPKLV